MVKEGFVKTARTVASSLVPRFQAFILLCCFLALPAMANAGTINTIAGIGTFGFSGDEGDATTAQMKWPWSVAVHEHADGVYVYIADQYNNRIRMVDPAGIIHTVAGDGSTASLNQPLGVAVDGSGVLYIADKRNNRLRQVNPGADGVVNGGADEFLSTVPGTEGTLGTPYSVTIDGSGDLFVAEYGNHCIRRVEIGTGTISVVAGQEGLSGDDAEGVRATDALLQNPASVAFDDVGNLYIADWGNHRVRMVSPGADGVITGAADETITTFAGTGVGDYGGDEGPALDAFLDGPYGVAFGGGRLYIADYNNYRVRMVDSAGDIFTVAGNGSASPLGDGGEATAAALNKPSGVTVTPLGELIIADSMNNRIRSVEGAAPTPNVPPTADDQSVELFEDATFEEGAITLTGNDSDGFISSYEIGTPPAHGDFYGTGAGRNYVPSEDFYGTDSFTFRVIDNNDAASDWATVSITVNSVNDPPVAGDDSATTDEETAVVVSVLTGDTDVEDGTPSGAVSLGTLPANGTAEVNADRTVTYAPADEYSGPDSFTYTVLDADGEASNEATVSVTVTAVNDVPVIDGQAGALETAEESPLTIVLGDLTVTDPDNAYPADFTLSLQDGDNYSVAGAMVTPDVDYVGTLTVPATVNDGVADSAPFSLSISVSNVNDVPVAADDSAATDEDIPVTVTVLDNDVDAEDGTPPAGVVAVVTVPTNGEAAVNGDRTITYTPNPGYSGVDTFTYTVQDADGIESNAATVTVSVAGVNDPPVITAQAGPLTTAEEVGLTLTLADLLVDDSDTAYPGSFTLAVQAGSDYTVAGATVTPDADFTGALTVPVTVNDGIDDSNVFDLSVTVTPVNDPPVIAGQAPLSVDEEVSLTVTLADLSVTDPDNAYPDGFTLTLQPGANYALAGATLTPAVDFVGTLTVPVTVNDGVAESAPFDLTVSVINVNDLPVAGDDSATVVEDGTVIIDVLANDTDVEDIDGIPAGIIVPLDIPNGTVNVREDRKVEYTPALNFNGPDFFTYTVQDADGAVSEIATVDVDVTAVNDPPVIEGLVDSLSTAEDTPITISFGDLVVIDPDNTYPDGFTLQFLPGANYMVAGDVITPVSDYNGPLNVTVLVSDGLDYSPTAKIAVDVTPVNDAPVANADDFDCSENASASVNVVANDTDAEEGVPTGSVELVSAPARGTAVVNGDRSITYTPDAGFDGTDSFEYRVRDGEGLVSAAGTVTANVIGVNDPPVITAQAAALTTTEGTGLNIALNDLEVTDPDDDYPAGFSLTLVGGANYSVVGTVVTPDIGSVGVLTVPVTVNDGADDSNLFDLSVEVTSNNVAPVIAGQKPLGTPEMTPLTITRDDLMVIDPDNLYPDDFTLSVQDGINYSRSGNQITPDFGFSGLLTVPVTVHDGRLGSGVFLLKVNVGTEALYIDVDGGGTHTAGVKSDGTLWAWGNNGNGQLGYDTSADADISSDTSSAVRQQVGTDSDWLQASLGLHHSLALRTDGGLWAWGRNIEGQLGDGTDAAKTVPAQIGGEVDWVAVAAGEKHSVALKSDGTLWAWGSNLKGQLGQGDKVARNVPTEVDADNFDPLNPWVSVAAGGSYTMALKADGSLWGWGDNWHGQLGVGTKEDMYLLPQPVGDPATVWKRIAADYGHSFAIDAGGALWAWGDNYYGQLGDGTTDEKLVPAQVSSENWVSVTAGHYFSAAIKGDGTLWTWGANDYGQLGSGGSLGLFRSSPEQVGVATDWIDVDGGNYHLAALQSDGNITVWGSNQNGQLGNGTRNDSVGRTVLFDNYTTPTSLGTQFISGLVTEDGVPGATTVEVEMAYIDDAGNSIVEPVVTTFEEGAGFWSANLTFSVETAYTVTVTASSPDPADIYTGEAERVIVYDATAPAPPSVTSSIDGEVGVALTGNTLPTWTWEGDAADGSGTFRYKLDDNTFGPADTGNGDVLYTPASALVDGSYTLYVQERDDAGNWSDSGSFAITVDNTPPAQPVVSSLIDGVVGVTDTNVTSPTWTWSTAGGGGFGYRRSLDGGPWSAETMAVSFTPGSLNEGTLTLAVQERDEVGNWSESGSFAITVDLTPPTLNGVADSLTNDDFTSLSGYIEAGASLDVSVDTAATTDRIVMGSMWFCNVVELTYGDNVLTFTATDAAGNTTIATATIYRNNPPSAAGFAAVNMDEDEVPNMAIDLTTAFDDMEDGPAGLTYTVENITVDAPLTTSLVEGTTLLTLDFVENASGAATITVRATDQNDLYVEDNLVVTVTPVNDLPTTAGFAPVTVDEDAADSTVILTDYFNDVEDGAAGLTYEVVNNSDASLVAATVEGGSLTLSYVENAYGSATITVRATDKGQGTDGSAFIESDLSVTVNRVNDPPQITSSVAGAGTATENVEWVYAATVADPDDTNNGTDLTWTLIDAPEGMTVSDTGVVTWTPEEGVMDSGLVTLQVADGGENEVLPASETFQVTTTAVNDAPQIVSVAPSEVTEGLEWSYEAQVVDPDDANDGENLLWSLSNAPEGMVVSPTGLVTWTPGEGVETSGTVVLNVADGGEDDALPATEEFTLLVAEVNDGPVITSTAPTFGTEGFEYVYAVTVEDPDDENDGVQLTWTLENEPAGMTISTTGVVTWTPAAGTTTSGSVTLTVADGGEDAALPATEVFSVDVTVLNKAPEITSTAPLVGAEGVEYRYEATVYDPDDANNGTDLIWSLSGEPAGMTVSEVGVVTWTPPEGVTTSGEVTLTVADGGEDGVSPATQTFTIDVDGVNDAPEITSTAPTEAYNGALFTYQAEVYDPDDVNNGIDLIWSLVNEPAGMTVSVTGLVSWTPDEGVTTSGQVTLMLTDGGEDGAGPDSQTFTLAVSENAAPSLVSPLVDQIAWIDTEYTFAVPEDTFYDEDLVSLELTASLAGGGRLPAWLDFDEGIFSGVPDGDLEALDIVITATDNAGLISDPPATFTLRVGRVASVQGAVMEWGSLPVTEGVPVRIPLAAGYENPVVIAKAASNSGFGFVQVGNVTSDAFDVEYVDSSASGVDAQTFYMVVEAGEQSLSGLTVQAGIVTSGAHLEGGQWSTIAFQKEFASAPAVFATVQSDNNATPELARSKSASVTGFEVALQGGGAVGTEQIGWIALQRGVAKTADGRHVMISATTAGDTVSRFDLVEDFCSQFVGSVVSEEYAARYPDLIQRLGQQAFAPYNATMVLGGLGSAFGDSGPVALNYRKADGYGVELSVETVGGGQTAMEDVFLFVSQ